MAASEAAVALRDVERDYRSLRPLRIRQLEIQPGESVAIIGLDRAAAEVLVNLVTGATLPDTGQISIFGTDTRDITNASSWMQALDDFGILSERVVLLEEMSVEQNLTVPLSLELEAAGPAVGATVRAVADEVGLDARDLATPTAALGPAAKMRLRLGKALITRPRMLLAEHPNAGLPAADVAIFAADLSRILSRRSLSALILTADPVFARSVARRVLTLQPATGELRGRSGWRRWLSG